MRFTYCPHCGDKLIHKEIGDEGLIPYCASCEVLLWDMFTTSIIAAVVNEEIDLTAKSLEYIKSYPYEKKEMLMLGYKAVADRLILPYSEK